MNRYALRVAIALLTFIIGVTFVAVWLIKWRNPISTSVNPSATEAKAITSAATISPDTADDYAVYSTVLAEKRYINEHTKQVVIEDETDDEKEISIALNKSLNEIIPKAAQSTIADYISKNKEPQHLDNLFKLKVERVLVSASEIKEIFENHHIEGWKIIAERYPDSLGLITLSRIGFNPERTQALVHVGIGCGGSCGEGNFFLLAKESGVWKVQKKIMTWIS
ncbi:MAG: hypothetical protein QOC96_1494 [Acidobacteriota bacterium]|jgi:hypothetical protein|nr:hypothetical protein [Acidobacteriota bacterium]